MLRLELDVDLLRQGAEEAGFTCKAAARQRSVILDLVAQDREGPLLLFDAADSANTGWFARCQFYVDGSSGAVLQAPFYVSNLKESGGRVNPRGVRLQVVTELPASARLPGRQAVSEQALYGVFFALLRALLETGVAVCGQGVVRPLAGRVEAGKTG